MKGAIGMLGDGQLAQMTCLAAREIGIPCYVYASSLESPAALVADRVFVGDFSDSAALAAFADAVDAVGYDTELLPIDCVRAVAQRTVACPHPDVLFATQNRIRERELLRAAQVPMPRVAAVETESDIERAGAITGWPAILKTAEQGYDGKGQATVLDAEAARRAFAACGNVPCVLEQRVEFAAEMSVIVAGD
ncbi:MAG: ATP-grasp domain-containing protein, partial [Firmicutes bacterium]|nr:ATP-grasp domain-containing protein [Bacillota bacterium]